MVPATVSLTDLESALHWVSTPDHETTAHLCRETGRIYSTGPDGPLDDDTPDDLDHETRYLPIPDQRELDLGQPLIRAFIADHAPALRDEVQAIFRRRGAYARFKSLLQRHGLLGRWHAFEHDATLRALTRWAREHGFDVVGPAGGPG